MFVCAAVVKVGKMEGDVIEAMIETVVVVVGVSSEGGGRMMRGVATEEIEMMRDKEAGTMMGGVATEGIETKTKGVVTEETETVMGVATEKRRGVVTEETETLVSVATEVTVTTGTRNPEGK